LYTEAANFGTRDICKYGGEKREETVEYVINELEEDIVADQLTIDLFTDNKSLKS